MEAEPRNFGPTTLRPASNALGFRCFTPHGCLRLALSSLHFVWLRPAYLLIALAPVAFLCGIAALRAQRLVWLPLAVSVVSAGRVVRGDAAAACAAPALAALSDGLVRNVEGTIIDAGPVREEVEQDVDEARRQRHRRSASIVRISSVEVVSDDKDAQESDAGWRAPDGALAGRRSTRTSPVSLRRADSCRCAAVAARGLSRSWRVEPQGLSASTRASPRQRR